MKIKFFAVFLLLTLCQISMAQIVSDSFSGTASYLDSRTPTLGNNWSSRSAVNSGAGSSNVWSCDGAGKAYCTTNNGVANRYALYQTSGSTVYTVSGSTANDYTVSASITQLTYTGKAPGVFARLDPSTGKCYTLYNNGYNGWNVGIYVPTSGGYTVLGSSSSISWPNGGGAAAATTITLQVSGTTITGKVGTQTVWTGTDTTLTTGVAGIVSAGGDNNTSTGYQFQNFQVYTSAPPVATGYSLSGPSAGAFSGYSGTAVGPYSVSLTPSGGTASATTVSLSDGGAGGTFYTLAVSSDKSVYTYTPVTSVSLATLTPTATFYYKNATPNSITLSTTNNGGLTNPSSVTQTFVADPYTRFALVGDSITNFLQPSVYMMTGGANTITDKLTWIGSSTARSIQCYNEGHPGQPSGFWADATAQSQLVTACAIANIKYAQIMVGTNDTNLSTNYTQSGATGYFTTSSAITASGTAQSVTVSTTAKMTVGGLVAIEPQSAGNTANCETVTVISIPDATHFTAVFTKNHASGVSGTISQAITSAVTSTGSQVIPVSDGSGFAVGLTATIDVGTNQETFLITAIGTNTVTGTLTKTHALGAPIGIPTTVSAYTANVTSFANAMVNAGITVLLHCPPYRTDGQDFLGMLPKYNTALSSIVTSINNSKCKIGDQSLYAYTLATPSDINDGRHPTSQGNTDMQFLWSVAWFRALWDTSTTVNSSGTKRKVQ